MFALFLSILFSSNVFAQDPCLAYQNVVPLPDWYSKVCGGSSRFRSNVGGGFSSYADALNLNPATLPTQELPLGVEVLLSKKTSVADTGVSGVKENDTSAQVSLIKGMNGYGFGFSSDSDDTIYSNRPTSNKTASANVFSSSGGYGSGNLFENLNFGAALSPLGRQLSIGQYLSPTIGALLKYSQNTQNWTPGFGVTLNAPFLSAGFSYSNEASTALFPEAKVYTFNLGLRIKDLQLEWVRILNQTYWVGTVTQIYTATFNLFGILWSGALRDSQDYQGGSTQIVHLGAKYNFSPKVSLGYLFNYVPGAHSLSLQLMF